jgi:uncharacterized membrane protein
MQGVIVTLQQWHLHPIIDHFTVAIFVLAVITDLVASVFSTRQWLRYSALSLVILAALLTWGSNVTGQWAERQVMTAVKAAGGPALASLNRHAWLGEDILPWLISVLAIWRIGIQLLNFIARSRPFYLLIAIAAMALISYEGYIGGELVYDYGVGTAIYSSRVTPSPAAVATPSGPPTPMPTVYVPTATATPSASGTATPSSAPSAAPSPLPAVKGMAGASAATATPSGAAESPSMAATPSASPAPSTSATTAPSATNGEEPKAESAPSSIPSTAIRPPAPRAGATSL